ncbi:hypothetical protein ABPG75_010179 [Micractinium tetrahymenae]
MPCTAAAAFWNSGVAVALGSCVCFAAAGALVKSPPIQGHIPVFEIVVVRALVSTLVTSLSCRAGGVPTFGRTAPQALLIARGVIGGTAKTVSYEALVRLPLADSTVIFYTCPVITALLAWLLLGERFTWVMAAGCGASLAGVLLVAQPPWLLGDSAVEWSHERLLGMVFGFAGAALAAGAYICIRLIGKREHPLTVAMYFHCFAFLSSVIPLAAGYPEPAVLPSPVQLALLVGIACGSFGGNLLVNRAFQLELAAKASALNFSQVIIAYLLGSVFFHDPITLLGLAGTALIACGVIVVNLEKLLAAARKGSSSSGGGGGGGSGGGSAGGPGLPTQQHPTGGPAQAPWWHRLLPRAGSEEPPLKAKLSDLEAELGRLPGPAAQQHRYQPIGR